jgi:hypothetical protein
MYTCYHQSFVRNVVHTFSIFRRKCKLFRARQSFRFIIAVFWKDVRFHKHNDVFLSASQTDKQVAGANNDRDVKEHLVTWIILIFRSKTNILVNFIARQKNLPKIRKINSVHTSSTKYAWLVG